MLDVKYECWALVIDQTECKEYLHLDFYDSMVPFSFFRWNKNIGVAFIDGDFYGGMFYKITAIPWDTEWYESKIYSITNVDEKLCGPIVKNGCWYKLSPDKKSEGGCFVVNPGEWTNGFE